MYALVIVFFLKLLLLFLVLPTEQFIGAFPIRYGLGSLLGKSTKHRGSVNKSFVKISSLEPSVLISQVLSDLRRLSVILHQLAILFPKLLIGHADGKIVRKNLIKLRCVSEKGSGAMVAAAPLTSGRSVAYQPVFQFRFPSLPSCSGSSSRLSRGSLYISTRAAISSSLWFIRA